MPIFRLIALAIAKSFSKLFGLATLTFFGRQPSRDDDKVAGVGVLSLVWLGAVIAAIFPAAGEVLIPFFDDETLIRWLAVGLAVAIPPGVGLVIAAMHNRRDDSNGKLAHMVFGYGYAAIVSVLVVAIVLVVPVVKVTHILRRFEVERIAVMVEAGTFDNLRDAIVETLERNGFDAEVERASAAIRWVFGALVWMEGRIFRRDVSTEMAVIRGEIEDVGWYEITLNATDITIIGRQAVATRLVALLSEELDIRTAYFSWDDESQAFEDAIRACREDVDAARPCDRERLAELQEQLRRLELSREEWNALRRHLFQVERDSERLRAEQAAGDRAAGQAVEQQA
jgi:hypothetical protein